MAMGSIHIVVVFFWHVGAQFMLKQLHNHISAISYDSNSIGPSMQMV